jgi:UTP--glucose-1-phosphate uridylyltransferase
MSSASGARSASTIDTVVIPVAGRGTRLLPATKAIRKELLPVGRKPLLLYAVEEAIASGAEGIIFVAAPNDRSVSQYFSRDLELEGYLKRSGRSEEAEALERLCTSASFTFVPQEFPRGLADAIFCARKEIAGRPFGVILPDAFILSQHPCIGQLTSCYLRHGGTVIATRLIERHEAPGYGVLVIDPSGAGSDSGVVRVRSMVEKPRPECAPSLYGIFGRYILEPGIFDAIEKLKTDASEELQLTDALNLYCQTNPVYGYIFEGEHFDTGNWLGYSKAVLECMLADDEIGPALSLYFGTRRHD